MINVVASYSKKLQFEYYGGNKYEGSDHFASLGTELPDGTDPESKYNELYDKCKRLVSAKILEELATIGNGIQHQQFMEICKKVARGEPVGIQEYETLSLTQKEIVQEFKLLGKRNAYVPRKSN